MVFFAGVVTLLCVGLLAAALRNDMAINANLGTASAEVDAVTFDRTIVRFSTPDGIGYSPPNGVLYPSGLRSGDLIAIEYDTSNPDLARVAGRSAVTTIFPLGTTVLVIWLLISPAIWWLTRRRTSTPEVSSAVLPSR